MRRKARARNTNNEACPQANTSPAKITNAEIDEKWNNLIFHYTKFITKNLQCSNREPEIGPFVISTRLLQILAATDIESNVVNDDHSQKKKSKQLSTHQIRAFVFSV